MKAHIGVDSKEGIVHSVCSTAASVSDIHMLPELLHGDEKKVRYRGLKKNHEWLCAGFALANLYLKRKRLAKINLRLALQGA
jgi:hypothetical protein